VLRHVSDWKELRQSALALPLTLETWLSITKDGWAIAPAEQIPAEESCSQTKRAPQLQEYQSEKSKLKPLVRVWNLPITNTSKFDISGLAVLCLDILYPLFGNFFGGLEVLVLPSRKIEVGIIQWRRRMLSNTVLDRTEQINICVWSDLSVARTPRK